MLLELHCHSTCSDGSVPPEQVARMAAERNLALFCLTDHDTWAGHDATAQVLDGRCTVLRGLELSCRELDRSIHLLVYGVKPGPGLEVLQTKLDGISIDRRDRIRKICERLAKLGVQLDPEPILAAAAGRVAGRPDVAKALVAAGVCTSMREVFDRFLGDGGPADVAIDRLGVEEGLALATAAGAKVSLAHPHTLGHPSLVRSLFTRFRAHGLEGLEAFYGRYSRVQSEAWLRLVRELDLVATAGSDFHGDMTPDIARPGVELPEKHAKPLRQWLGLAA